MDREGVGGCDGDRNDPIRPSWKRQGAVFPLGPAQFAQLNLNSLSIKINVAIVRPNSAF